MAREELVWTANWKQLKEAGLTFKQAKLVHSFLDQQSAFRYRWLSDSAWRQLEEVYGEVRV